eukprot:1435143-Pleurochrysis_carterae.AAC.1
MLVRTLSLAWASARERVFRVHGPVCGLERVGLGGAARRAGSVNGMSKVEVERGVAGCLTWRRRCLGFALPQTAERHLPTTAWSCACVRARACACVFVRECLCASVRGCWVRRAAGRAKLVSCARASLPGACCLLFPIILNSCSCAQASLAKEEATLAQKKKKQQELDATIAGLKQTAAGVEQQARRRRSGLAPRACCGSS